MGLVRSDTMLETNSSKRCFTKCQNDCTERFYCCVAMVEINTIASGFGWLGPSSKILQRCNIFCLPVWLDIILLFVNYKTKSSAASALPKIVSIAQESSTRFIIVVLNVVNQFSLCLFSSLHILFCFVLQTITLGLLRSDYFNTDQNKILQVEFNTIASSLSGVGSQFQHFHR